MSEHNSTDQAPAHTPAKIPSQKVIEERLRTTRSQLLRHLGGKTVLIFLEVAPHGVHGARCRHPLCEDNLIKRGLYRVAVTPGMYDARFPDYYHVECFETLVDFSKPEHLSKLKTLTKHEKSLPARGLSRTYVLDGTYFLDDGAKKLVHHWMQSMARLIAQRDESQYTSPDPEVVALLYQEGSASYTPTQHQSVSNDSHDALSGSRAPMESGGPDAKAEWNLFDIYVPLAFDKLEDLNQRHSLSSMLQTWKLERDLVAEDIDKAREKMDDKAILAIFRLSVVHKGE
ncbi:hypothetical protein F5Y18DRAFT_430467 [Xylariaceae sp. FL1019]|nr:hypothetical protein F5Y18DRAFT_430467 [Xylariaceae sp. FL1019]